MDEMHVAGAQFMAVAMGSPSMGWRPLPPRAPAQASAESWQSLPPLPTHVGSWRPLPPLASPPPYAGFWRRFQANLIDGILMGTALHYLNLMLNVILVRFNGLGDLEEDPWRAFAVWLTIALIQCIVINWLYYAMMESSPWQATIGKRVLGMVVTDLAGHRISFGRATARMFARVISGLLLYVGYLIQPFTAKRQALHDMIAGTVVIIRPVPIPLALTEVSGGPIVPVIPPLQDTYESPLSRDKVQGG